MSDDDSSSVGVPWFLLILAVVLAGLGWLHSATHGALRSLAGIAFVLVAVGAGALLVMFFVTTIVVTGAAARANVPLTDPASGAYLTLLAAAAVGVLVGFGAPVTGPGELAAGPVFLVLYYSVAHDKVRRWHVQPRWLPNASVWVLSVASVAVGAVLLFAT